MKLVDADPNDRLIEALPELKDAWPIERAWGEDEEARTHSGPRPDALGGLAGCS